MTKEELLNLLEELLALTEESMRDTQDWRAWQKISATVADIRDGDAV